MLQIFKGVKIGALALTVLILPIAVCAEPSPAIQKLMNEPASLFDLGMHNLNDHLAYAFPAKGINVTVANYDYSRNRIRISRSETLDSGQDFAKSICETYAQEIKGALGVHDGDKLILNTIGSFFAHDGYENKKTPKNIGIEIRNITEIEVILFCRGGSVTCYGALDGKSINFKNK